MGPAENAGKPWTPAEEATLVRAFEAGAKISQLARQHGRTRQAIQGRLYRLGKVPQGRLGAVSGSGAEKTKAEMQGPVENTLAAGPRRGRGDGRQAAA